METGKNVRPAQYGAEFNRPSEAFAYANSVVERSLAAAIRNDSEAKKTIQGGVKRHPKSSEK